MRRKETKYKIVYSGFSQIVLSFLLIFTLPPAPLQGLDQTVIVPLGSDWLYNDSGANLGANWYQSIYSTASPGWEEDQAELGFGDGDEATVVNNHNCPGGSLTWYFQRSFNVSDPASIGKLDFSLIYDDGAVVYLNGTEVFRINLPGGTINYNTAAIVADDFSPVSGQIDPALLLSGSNHISIEIHQASCGSSDISMDFELVTFTQFETDIHCYTVADNGGGDDQDDLVEFFISRNGIGPAITRIIKTDIFESTGSNVESLEYDPVNNVLYGGGFTTGGTFHLVNIDPANGNFQTIGSGFGTLTDGPDLIDGNSNSIGPPWTINDVDGMAFDPHSQILYGSVRVGDGEEPEDIIIAIDISTGAFIPDFFPDTNGDSGDDYMLATPVASGLYDVDDLAVDPNTGVLYGVFNEGNSQTFIFRVDPTIGTGSLTEYNTVQFNGSDLQDVEGLSIDPINGHIYGITGSAAPADQRDRVYKITLATAGNSTAILVSGLPGSDFESCSCTSKLPANLSVVIGNYVWVDEDADGIQDAGENGIANVLVELLDGMGSIIASTRTDYNGGYLFRGVVPGNYTVRLDQSTISPGLWANPTFDEDDGAAAMGGSPNHETMVTVSPGDEYLSADFGYNWESVIATDNPGSLGSPAGSIGDRIYKDVNGNGIQDMGESGIEGVGLALYYDSDGDGFIDSLYSGGTTLSNDFGNYIFENLPPGIYDIVVYEASGAPPVVGAEGKEPTGYLQTADPDHFGKAESGGFGENDNRTSRPVILGPGDTYLNVDFGYQPTRTVVSIGNRVFLDVNINGSDDGEFSDPGIDGVTVVLKNANGFPIATTITGQNPSSAFEHGWYDFPGLTPLNDYSLELIDYENVLGGFQITADPDGKDDRKSAVPNLIFSDYDQDFGFAPDRGTIFGKGFGAIGDMVFMDTNGNGIPDHGEGIENVVLTLVSSDGTTISRVLTNELGNYLFDNLPDNTYTIIIDVASLPFGGAGINNFEDPDAGLPHQSLVVISGGNTNLLQDFGYRGITPNTISGTIWEDSDAEGDLDESATGIADVEVRLLDNAGNLISIAFTDASGNYSFTGLPDGAYVIDVKDETGSIAGYWHSDGPNDGSNNNSQDDTYSVTVSGGQTNTTGDFGYYQLGSSIGNYIWEDVDQDGLQIPAEPGIPNAKAILEITYPGGALVRLSSMTDASGLYSFNNLLRDEDYNGDGLGIEPTYMISAGPIAGMVATPVIDANGNGDDLTDSDDHSGVTANPVQGKTDVSSGNDSDMIASQDFGFINVPLPIELIYFRGFEENCEMVLEWGTLTETNSNYFILEKSFDGVNFERLVKVPAAGNSNIPIDYQFVDKYPNTRNYYRLILIDLSGHEEISGLVNIDLSCDNTIGGFNIFPNPGTSEDLSIKFFASFEEQSANLSGYNVLGIKVFERRISVREGTNLINIDQLNIVAGTYYFIISGEGWISETLEFVKIK